MFQRVLLAWEEDHPPLAALAAARNLVRVCDAELTVATVVRQERHPHPPAVAAPDLGRDVLYARVVAHHPAAGLLSFAHEHGFDLLVVGHHAPERVHRVFTRDIARELAREAEMPVLVIAEADAPGGTDG